MAKEKYPTAHIDACPEDFAKTVLMPGDPKRSEFIAKNFLSIVILLNSLSSYRYIMHFLYDLLFRNLSQSVS